MDHHSVRGGIHVVTEAQHNCQSTCRGRKTSIQETRDGLHCHGVQELGEESIYLYRKGRRATVLKGK